MSRSFWRHEEVIRFLGCEPTCPQGELELEAVFRFPVGALQASLHIHPAGHSVKLSIGGDDAPIVESGMECRMVYVSDEVEEEGGRCLILAGIGSHVAITRAAEGFRIFFGLHGREGRLPKL